MLWHFALMAVADRVTNLHIDLEGQIPDMRFSKVGGLPPRIKNIHTFGCPVYILDAKLQNAGRVSPKK